jgi:hypothetical protein
MIRPPKVIAIASPRTIRDTVLCVAPFHSDDFVTLIHAKTFPIALERHMLADGVAVAEVVAGHCLIDHRHAEATLILESEVAPSQAIAVLPGGNHSKPDCARNSNGISSRNVRPASATWRTL